MSGRSFKVRNKYGIPTEEKDIGTINLKTSYSSWFLAMTIFLIILVFGVVGLGYYTADKFNKKDIDRTDKTILWTLPSVLTGVIIIMSVFYFMVIYPDLKKADILSTDLTRLTTGKLTDQSFKTNLTDLVASRTGKNADEIYNNITSSIMVDPHGYFKENNLNLDKVAPYIAHQFQKRPEGTRNIIAGPEYVYLPRKEFRDPDDEYLPRKEFRDPDEKELAYAGN